MPMMKWLTTIPKNNKLSYIKKLPIQTRELEIMWIKEFGDYIDIKFANINN